MKGQRHNGKPGTVGTSIGDKRLIGSVCKRSEAEDDKVPETVDGDPIGLNIEDGKEKLKCKDCEFTTRSELHLMAHEFIMH